MSALRHPAPDPDAMTLVFYAPDGGAARRLAERLHGIEVRWEDSGRVAPSALATAGTLVLLDFSPAAAAQSSALAAQLKGLALVAVGATREDRADGVLAALRAGVRDFVDLDAPAEDIGSRLRKLYREAAAAAAPLAPVPPPPRGRLVALLGARAGLGTSTLAVHLGSLAAESMARAAATHENDPPGNHVLLLDLGAPAGDPGLYLDLHGEFDLDAALRNAERMDAILARTALSRHASGMALLGRSGAAGAAPPADPAPLVSRLRTIFGLVLCDLGGIAPAALPTATLRQADELWIVADQSIGALVAVAGLLEALQRERLHDGRLQLVVNRHDEDSGLAPQRIAERFGLPLLATVPERLRPLRAAANQGALLQRSNPRDRYLRALPPLLQRLHPQPPPSARGFLPRGLRLPERVFTWTRK